MLEITAQDIFILTVLASNSLNYSHVKRAFWCQHKNVLSVYAVVNTNICQVFGSVTLGAVESNCKTNFIRARVYLAFLCLVIKKYSVFDKWIVSFYLLMSKLIRLWNSKDINYCPFRHFKSTQLIPSWFPADPSVFKPFQVKLRGLILKNRNCMTVNDVECS